MYGDYIVETSTEHCQLHSPEADDLIGTVDHPTELFLTQVPPYSTTFEIFLTAWSIIMTDATRQRNDVTLSTSN